MKYRERIGDYLKVVSDVISPSLCPSKQFHHYSIPAHDEKKKPRVELGENIKSNKTIVYPSTILVSKLNPRFRRVWKILECDENSICSTEFIELAFKNKSNTKYIDFFTALFNTNHFMEYLGAVATGTSGSHQRVKLDDILGYEFELKNDREKREIGRTYRRFDEKIELNRQMNKTLESIAQAIFKHWFVDFEFPNEEGKPYKSSGGKMVKSELGEIPRDWYVNTFSQLVMSIKEPLKPGEYISNRKYVPIECIPMKQVGMLECKSYKDAKSGLIAFEPGDILFGAMRAYFHRVNYASFKGVTRTTTFVLRPRNTSHFMYALFLLNKEESVDYANQHSTGTTIPYAIWENGLANMPIIMPYTKILEKFSQEISFILNRMNELPEEINTLSQIRDSLLPKLLSGKIRLVDSEAQSLEE